RDKVLKFEGGFHGMGDVALMSNQWLPAPLDPPRPVPVSAGIPASAARDVIVARFNDTAGTVELIERFQDELAAVIVEPMQRTLQPVPGFLQAVREATARLGIPLVFDEVVTGFRLALGGAQEYYGVIPDLCAMGKSISAGLPLGLVCGRADIMSLAEPARRETGAWVALTGTYSGNPVVASAALAAIEVLERPGTYERLFATGRRLMDGLRRALAAAGLAAHVTGEPPAFEAWFTDEEVTDFRAVARSDHRLGRRFAERLIDRGILKAHEKFFVSLAHDADDVDRTIRAFEAAALELAASPPSIDENLV
ncbi:MAG: aminotransferase class III-fold pyridoxal phosphate-dependent enzyme, partial [Deltaproteobacteria bacterium]